MCARENSRSNKGAPTGRCGKEGTVQSLELEKLPHQVKANRTLIPSFRFQRRRRVERDKFQSKTKLSIEDNIGKIM